MKRISFVLCLLITLSSLANKIEILDAGIHCSDNGCRKIFCCDSSNINKFKKNQGYLRQNNFNTDFTEAIKRKCENQPSCEFSLNSADYGGDELDSSYTVHVKYICRDEEGGVIKLPNKTWYTRGKDFNMFHEKVSKSKSGHINCVQYPKDDQTSNDCALSTTCRTCSKWGCCLVTTGLAIFGIVEAVIHFG